MPQRWHLRHFLLVWSFGGLMDFLSNINFVLIAQLTVLAMVVISGPVIVFLLSLRGGDL